VCSPHEAFLTGKSRLCTSQSDSLPFGEVAPLQNAGHSEISLQDVPVLAPPPLLGFLQDTYEAAAVNAAWDRAALEDDPNRWSAYRTGA
jgi:hypothetical protein